LVEGGSGSGKSSVAEGLTKRNYSAITSDQLCYNGDTETSEPVETRKHDTWMLDLPKILSLLKNDDDITFICGGACNGDKILSYSNK
jgi:uridine kinase